MIHIGDNSYYSIKAQLENGLRMLENKEFYFYGTHNNCFKIDDMILEVLEDPEDGYRSSLGCVRHVLDLTENRFFKKPLAKIILKSYLGGSEYTNGWELVDIETGHQWLLFGTANCDDYYPYFIFRYLPDQSQTNFPEIDPFYEPFKERHPELLLKYPDWFAGITISMG